MAKYESLKKASVARAKESGMQITTTQVRTQLLQTESFLSFVTERAHLVGHSEEPLHELRERCSGE